MSPASEGRSRTGSELGEPGLNSARVKLRHRARRIGLIFIVGSPAVGLVFGGLFRSEVGILLGVLCLTIGAYTAFAYAPFAEWIRRREKSR